MFEKKTLANAKRAIEAATVGKQAVEEKLRNGEINIAELSEILRAEMQTSFKVYREEMNKNFEEQKSRMRQEALWQWIICAAIVISAVVKEVFF